MMLFAMPFYYAALFIADTMPPRFRLQMLMPRHFFRHC